MREDCHNYSTEFRATEVTSVPLDEDNCCTDRITGRRGEASRRVASSRVESRRVAKLPVRYTIVSCFSRFYGWSLAHKSVSRTFSASYSAAVPIRSKGRKSETRGTKDGRGTGEEKRGDREGRMDEACGTRSPTRPSGNSTRSSTYHPLLSHGIHARASAAGCEGEENPALIAAGE